MKNILILGGCGFIGTNLVEEFIKYPDEYNITVFDHRKRKHDFGCRAINLYGDFINWEELDKILSENRFDSVIHLISTTIPASSNEKIVHDIEANLIPSVRLLKMMSNYNIPEIVFFSSGGSVYGVTNEEKVNEMHSTFPVSSHGTIKLTIEKYIHLFQELYGLKYLILRVGNAYGPFQSSDEQGIINVFIRRILKNEILNIRGDGKTIRDYIYVKDLAAILQLLLKKGITNEIINVGSGKGTSIEEILEIMGKLTGRKNIVEYIDPLPTDVPKIILNTEKLQSFLNYPITGIEEGIRMTYNKILEEGL